MLATSKWDGVPSVAMRVRAAALSLGILTTFWAGITSPVLGQRNNRPPRPGGERPSEALKVGDTAPDFSLKTLDGKQTVTLSSFRGQKPVALIFGSYT